MPCTSMCGQEREKTGIALYNTASAATGPDRKTSKLFTFGVNDCAFGYRNSFFKSGEKNRYIILNVTFILNKIPVLNTSYGAIRAELEQMEVRTPSIRTVSEAVINIRKSKLADSVEIGHAGSFFMNLVLYQSHF